MKSSTLSSLYIETVALKPEYFIEAAIAAQSLTSRAQRSQVRLHMLALQGFVDWLSSQPIKLDFDASKCSLHSPAYANVVSAACNLKLGEFKICLLATRDIHQEIVSMPRAVVELNDFSAHFYVLMQIVEEEDVIILRGMMRRDRLFNYLNQHKQPKVLPNWTYLMPLTLFDTAVSRLPLSANCLAPASLAQKYMPTQRADANEHSAIEKPATERPVTEKPIAESFPELWTYLQSVDIPIWKSMRWEQGAALLRSLPLLKLMLRYQQDPDLGISLTSQVERLLQSLRHPVANITRWLQRGLDDFAKELGFYELEHPLAQQKVALCKTPFERCENIANLLRENGLPIPADIRVFCYPITSSQRQVICCIIPFQADTENNSSSLFASVRELSVRKRPTKEQLTREQPTKEQRFLAIVLPENAGYKLPVGTQLSILSEENILTSSSLHLESSSQYAMVEVGIDAPVEVSVEFIEGSRHTLPPFSFSQGVL